MSEFHTALARITCAQLCRASGIDRCSPTALDVLTDVLIRYISILGSVSARAADNSGHEEADLADVALALADMGALRPSLDPNDMSDITELRAWANGETSQRLNTVARFRQQALSALGAAQGAAIAAQQAAHDVHAAAAQATHDQTTTDNSMDWLQVLVDKQMMMGHDKKYRNTVFGGEDVDDREADKDYEKIVIGGGPPTVDDFFAQHAA